MLETLKQMQVKGIFKLFPSDLDIDTLVNNANTEEDIKNYLKEIQDYIKSLDVKYRLDYGITIGNTLSDFSDKFQYEMFNMYIGGIIKDPKVQIHQKDISFGDKAGTGVFGISSETGVKFSIEERKLLKLINHYYIKLKSNGNFNDSQFYIPFDNLKLMYVEDVNNLLLKTSITETCSRLNDKLVYWNMENTRYNQSKKLKDKKLSVIKGDKLVDITVIYQPREHAKGIDGKVFTIKGILCKITSFMKLRYEIKQIYNYFPTKCLRSKYLDFAIMEKTSYHLNILTATNAPRIRQLQNDKTPKKLKQVLDNNLVSRYKVSLVDLARSIYYYDAEQTSTDYFSKMLNEPNVKRRLVEFIGAVVNVCLMISSTHNYKGSGILLNGKAVKILDDKKNRISTEEIYNEILNMINSRERKGQVFKHFSDGELFMVIKM